MNLECKYPESRASILKTNQQVERLTEIIFTLVMKISLQLQMLPKSIACYAVYFMTESGSDSFDLPFPVW